MPSIKRSSQFFIALIAGAEANEPGHADVVRIVVFQNSLPPKG